MTGPEYRTKIAALGLTQVGAAKALGIGERTSRRYAAQGVPEKHSHWLRSRMDSYRQSLAANSSDKQVGIREANEP